MGSGSQVQDTISDTMQPPGTHSPLQGPASEAELLIQLSRGFQVGHQTILSTPNPALAVLKAAHRTRSLPLTL